MVENFRQSIDQRKMRETNAGKLVQSLLARGKLTEEDLLNPDIIELVNDTKEVSLEVLQLNDKIYYIEDYGEDDTENPKHSLIKGKIVYAGPISALGYNDKQLSSRDGVTVEGRNVFPVNTVEKYTQKILPVNFNLALLTKAQRIFRVNFNVEAKNRAPNSTAMFGKLVTEG